MQLRVRYLVPSIIAAFFILLFVYTAINKFMTRVQFAAVLNHSPLLQNFNTILSWSVPVTELVIAFLLFVPAYRRAGLLCSLVLMGLFTGYIAYMLAFASKLPCSCGGVLQHLSWREHLWFNIGCTVLAGIGYYFQQTNQRFIAINRTSRKPV